MDQIVSKGFYNLGNDINATMSNENLAGFNRGISSIVEDVSAHCVSLGIPALRQGQPVDS
jgi:hypothetical protein